MKRNDFVFWAFGLFFIYIGFASDNPTTSYGVYVPYNWQIQIASILVIIVGFILLCMPFWLDAFIDIIREDEKIKQMSANKNGDL